MTPNPTLRRLILGLLVGATLLVASTPAQAQIALPSIAQDLYTPLGNANASAGQDGAQACLRSATPSLPALPVPIPVPVPVALPTAYAAGDACIQAGLDGVSADVDANALGFEAGASQAIDTSQQHDAADGVMDSVKGFFTSLVDGLRSLF